MIKKTNLIFGLMLSALVLAACSPKSEQKPAESTSKQTAEVKQEMAKPAATSTSNSVKSSSGKKLHSEMQKSFAQAEKVIGGALQEATPQFQAGQHYDEFLQPVGRFETTGDKIEVVEFYSAGCPACFNAEPFMQAIKTRLGDDVNFVQVPAPINTYFEHLARGQFAAQALGVDPIADIKIFEAIRMDRKQLSTPNEMAAFYADYGISKEDFIKSYNSFSVNSRMAKTKEMMAKYGVNGVPTIVVNGKYRSGSRKAGTFVRWAQILKQLVEQERAAK